MLPRLKSAVRRTLEQSKLPPELKAEVHRDQQGLPRYDPGPEAAVRASLNWLCTAQDRSATRDGGVARHYSFLDGWSASYPETTGYIIPTMLAQAGRLSNEDLMLRGRRMLDWLVGIQLPGGGFQGSVIGATPVVPVTFNTGQILIGLAAGVRVFGDPYRVPMQRAADWLVDSQDPDGCWRRNPSPFTAAGEKTYETHVAWGLLEAARIGRNGAWAEAALKNMRWAVGRQQANGWFANCCLNEPDRPLTHTIGYVLRGLVEGYLFSRESWLLQASVKTAEALLTCQRSNGFMPGRLDSNWQPAGDYACLTGIVQIASCWLLLDAELDRSDFRRAARRGNAYVRRTIHYDGPADIAGGVKGSFPVNGGYGKYQMLNWAAKFSIDANTAELSAPGAS